MLKMDHTFAGRYLNDGFSGGEKKRAEILQMAALEPRSPFWMRPIPAWISMRCASFPRASTPCAAPSLGVLVITHYQRILNYIKPDFVHIMLDGRIVEIGRRRAGAAPRRAWLRLGAREERRSWPL